MCDVGDLRRPDEPVAGLVATACRIDDRVDDQLDQAVLDDEDEHRLRQKTRLEDATSILVRHAAFAAVADRLDHGHTDVAGCVLDRVDHGLDTLPDHDRLHLHHRLLLVFGHKKRPRATRRWSEASMPLLAVCGGGQRFQYYTMCSESSVERADEFEAWIGRLYTLGTCAPQRR